MRINVYIPSDLAEDYMLIKDQLNLSALVQELIRKEIDARRRTVTHERLTSAATVERIAEMLWEAVGPNDDGTDHGIIDDVALVIRQRDEALARLRALERRESEDKG